jgi:hypothetical protein
MTILKKTPINDVIFKYACEKARLGAAYRLLEDDALERISRCMKQGTLVAVFGGTTPVEVTAIGRRHMGGFFEWKNDESKVIF